MSHSHKKNDSRSKSRYATQGVPTAGTTIAGSASESSSISKRSKNSISRGLERVQNCFRARSPVTMTHQDGKSATGSGYNATTSFPGDAPGASAMSYPYGGDSPSRVQNQPAQFLPKTDVDTAQRAAFISYPTVDTHTSSIKTNVDAAQRAAPMTYPRADTHTSSVRSSVEASHPSTDTHTSGVRTNVEASQRTVPASYPSADTRTSGVRTNVEASQRAMPASYLGGDTHMSSVRTNVEASKLAVPASYPSADTHTSGVRTNVEASQRGTPVSNPSADIHISSVRTNVSEASQHATPISYPNADTQTSGIMAHKDGVERSPLIQNITTSNTIPGVKEAVKRDDAIPNVIVFGESGVGKSSLINMIAGTDSAVTSNEAIGCTFQSTSYDVELQGHKYRLWDTIGLNEGERGTASPELSIQNLHRLVLSLQHEGVNLLVYCIRGSRIRDIIKINYELFWKIICNEQVPIVVVVTGLENEEDMEDWWRNNRRDFAARGMKFRDHACVTTTKGKRMRNGEYMFEAEFDHSVQLVQELIAKCCPKTPWKPDGSRWLIDIVQTMKQMFLLYESQSHPTDDTDSYTSSRGRGEGYGSHRSQARNGTAMPDTLTRFIANMVAFNDEH